MIKFEFNDAIFEAQLQAALVRLPVVAAAELLTLGNSVASRARQLCPVRTGRLRDSITVSNGIDERGPFVDIAAKAPYAIFVEFGTYKMAPNPFMRSALLASTAAWRPTMAA